MEDLDNGTLCDMIASMAEHLEDIMSEKVPCERMFTFLHGTESERIGLSHNCPMGHFTNDQHELIIHELSNMLPKNTKNLELQSVTLKGGTLKSERLVFATNCKNNL